MEIRRYREEDFDEIAELFYHTVHWVNRKDYSQEQIEAWAPKRPEKGAWNGSLLENYSIVAVEKGQVTGFGDIDKSGYLDRLYVHKDYQGRGTAAAICDELEKHAEGKRITVHASITAKPFFEKRGYLTVKEQQILRRGVFLTNYVMKMEKTCNI
ncbi:GNAT family N-acetyltransferase [Clostridium sp. AM58-1XD]|uniref:GNAT family N-acetyltransferase n=1 Tax=Clostridium sp. AM58-1XD TaxID=2292307 RepID=UPI000E52A2B5|nr:GNAT family N-acetyltransferase [Clostridium sp. AM58-1XD]RGY95699.1 GNAT family N-acetyltransferase [Clostridium sp. AM58-1XD]